VPVKNKAFKISKQAKMGVWHQKLKDSQTINADALKSNIFQEIFDSNNLDHEAHDHDMGLLQRM